MSELQHRLAAILAADVAGYSRLMSIDDKATVVALDAARAVFRTQVEAQQGRIIDMAGDSVLAVFGTAAGAVTAALAIQAQVNALAETEPEDRRMRFRIGVHLGDVIEKADGTVYGEGVNIAARLEGLADPGGATVSESIRSAVKGKVAASFEDQAEQAVKNIADPVRAWRLRGGVAGPDSLAPATAAPSIPAIELSLPDEPSIAVLPFTNMSGDPEQEYFTDGITEDIITELSRLHSLFVIARNSSFSYKGQSPDIRRVGKELGVRYVLEGSIRKSVNRIRVTAQLIDAITANQLWAEKYDRMLEDIFAVQEELTRSIVATMAPHIDEEERSKVHRLRPESLGAYERVVIAWTKALAAHIKADLGLRNSALAEAQAVRAIHPRSSRALHVIALVQWQHYYLGTEPDRQTAWHAGLSATLQAIEIDRNDCDAYALKAMLLTVAPDRQRTAEALPTAQRAYELNPNNMLAVAAISFAEIGAGLTEQSAAHLHHALRLSPRDPFRQDLYLMLATLSLFNRDYAKGVEYALLGIADAPNLPALGMYLALNHVGLGDIGKSEGGLRSCAPVGARLGRWSRHGQGHCPCYTRAPPQDIDIPADRRRPGRPRRGGCAALTASKNAMSTELPIPEKRYAETDDLSIACQVFGNGARDLVIIPGIVSHIEAHCQHANYARILRSLAQHFRVIFFDRGRPGSVGPVRRRAHARRAHG
jgi:adenylate cyclase